MKPVRQPKGAGGTAPQASAAGQSSICTIGYENATPPRLLQALQEARVATLVDVRAIANSRRPGFAKRALSAAVEEAGIGYLHLPALGTPAAGREAARSGRPAEMRRIFARHLEGTEPQAALGLLRDRAARERVCLLCLEADPAGCHRTLVAEAVGMEIRHLHP